MSTPQTFQMFLWPTCVCDVDTVALGAYTVTSTMRSSTRRLYAAFGELVVAHRRRLRGMTQAELGGQVGLSRTSVTNIERGRQRVSLDTFLRIAAALGVAPENLLPPLSRESQPSRMAEIMPDSPKELVEWAESL